MKADASPSIRNLSVENVTTNEATFHGCLISTGSSATAVCVLWGETDGGTNWPLWAHTNWWAVGVWTNHTCPRTNITGLATNRMHYYTFAAANASTGVVAAMPVSFLAGEVTVETTADMADYPDYAGEFTVRRPATATNAPLTVCYAMSGSASNGVDYVLLTNRVTLAAGAASAVVTVHPLKDADVDSEEAVLTLTAGGYAIGTPSTATVTIWGTRRPGVLFKAR